jgi:hypothetical protein
MLISHILCYNGSLVTWKVVSLTTKFKPLILFMSCFTLSLSANMFTLMILYVLMLVACSISLHNRKDGKLKAYAKRGPVCPLEIFQWGAEHCFALLEHLLLYFSWRRLWRVLSPGMWRRGIGISSGSVVVKALCCKPEGRGFQSRWGGFFKLT